MKYRDLYEMDRKIKKLEYALIRAKTREDKQLILKEIDALLDTELVIQPQPTIWSKLYGKIFTNRSKGVHHSRVQHLRLGRYKERNRVSDDAIDTYD